MSATRCKQALFIWCSASCFRNCSGYPERISAASPTEQWERCSPARVSRPTVVPAYRWPYSDGEPQPLATWPRRRTTSWTTSSSPRVARTTWCASSRGRPGSRCSSTCDWNGHGRTSPWGAVHWPRWRWLRSRCRTHADPLLTRKPLIREVHRATGGAPRWRWRHPWQPERQCRDGTRWQPCRCPADPRRRLRSAPGPARYRRWPRRRTRCPGAPRRCRHPRHVGPARRPERRPDGPTTSALCNACSRRCGD